MVLQLLQGCSPTRKPPPTPTHTHTYTHIHTHRTPQANGESTHSCPPRKKRWQGLWFLRAALPFFSTSSPSPLSCGQRPAHVIQHSLMLHYPYTSLSLSASLKAMFPHVASKLGHEHGTHRRGKDRVCALLVCRSLSDQNHQVDLTTCALAVVWLHQRTNTDVPLLWMTVLEYPLDQDCMYAVGEYINLTQPFRVWPCYLKEKNRFWTFCRHVFLCFISNI